MLDCFSTKISKGFEKFFDEAVDLDVTDTEAYVAKALAKKYNMKIVGPPLDA